MAYLWFLNFVKDGVPAPGDVVEKILSVEHERVPAPTCCSWLVQRRFSV